VIGASDEVQPRCRDLAEDAHREAGTGERLPPHELVLEPELLADFPDFVLEQHAQRLDQLEAHAFRQAADVVVRLDDVRRPDHRDAFDDVGIQRPLAEKIERADVFRLVLEHVDERRADDLALPFRIHHAGQP
jgi:hypothetical protein